MESLQLLALTPIFVSNFFIFVLYVLYVYGIIFPKDLHPNQESRRERRALTPRPSCHPPGICAPVPGGIKKAVSGVA